MPRRGKSECVAEGLSQQVDVKIAGRGRTDKRTSTVLVVIPARVIGQPMSGYRCSGSPRAAGTCTAER
jgi:hypothetical protein